MRTASRGARLRDRARAIDARTRVRYGKEVMKHRRVTATRGTMVVACWLAATGLLIPSQAQSMLASKGSRAKSAVSTRGATTHEARPGRLAKGRSKPQKKIRAGEAPTTSSSKGRTAAAGRGRPEKLVCAEAFDRAKETARESRFRAAKEWLARCARPNCARSLRQHCAALHAEVIALLPSVVPVLTDAADNTNRQIGVKVDGEILTSNLDGTAMAVDPGDHEFTFLKDGEVVATRRFTVEKRRRNQVVAVSLESQRHKSVALSPTTVAGDQAVEPEMGVMPVRMDDAIEDDGLVTEEAAPRVIRRVSPVRPANAQADQRTGSPWSAYALAGVGLLGVGGYGAFTLKGRADNDALIAGCKPDCSPTSVHHVRNLYLAADISLGIGVAALLASTYLFFRSDSAEESQRSRTSHISGLIVEPTSSGAVAAVGGTF
jgi:hypothetical protein